MESETKILRRRLLSGVDVKKAVVDEGETGAKARPEEEAPPSWSARAPQDEAPAEEPAAARPVHDADDDEDEAPTGPRTWTPPPRVEEPAATPPAARAVEKEDEDEDEAPARPLPAWAIPSEAPTRALEPVQLPEPAMPEYKADPAIIPSAPLDVPKRASVTVFFDDRMTNASSYVVSDPATGSCVVIDPILDFDPRTGYLAPMMADLIVDFIQDQGLALEWIIETHLHTDHLTAAPYLKHRLGGKIGIGRGIVESQTHFRQIFNMKTLRGDGSEFDYLFDDEEEFQVGNLSAVAFHTPGHTPVCTSFLIDDALFVGDTLFMPDFGTPRCDFPGGDARMLWQSIQRILTLPEQTRLFVCHDYGPGGRDYAVESTVGLQRDYNIHLTNGMTEEAFVALRQERDSQLLPAQIMPSAVQVNIRGGLLPDPEDNGVVYLKLPINIL